MVDAKEDIRNLLEKYRQKVEKELGNQETKPRTQISSREYSEFKQQYMPKHLSLYEQFCNKSEKIIKIKPDAKSRASYEESINICHLNVTPEGVLSFAVLAAVFIAIFGGMFLFFLFGSLGLVLIAFVMAAITLAILQKYPTFVANNWRLKASNQMVLCIFYIVTYMRHTSNLERAIEFAAEHLSPPLSLDLRKILWDVETEKYESIKEALDVYLETWKKWNMEFIEAFHLIESSLYEGSEERRLTALDKSLDVILNETYEKMLHYAHNLKAPITMLHMLGIILPILGLVILPLVVSFLGEDVPTTIAVIAGIYNIMLPILVFYMGRNILSTRPTGYGDTDISQENPELKKYKNIVIKVFKTDININPAVVSIMIGGFLLLLGFSPLIIHAFGTADIGFGQADQFSPCLRQYCFLDYRPVEGTTETVGPFGLGASILSLAITLGLGLSIGLYYRLRTKNIIKIRERSKKLEQEFASALFQLGNRLGDGIPAEMAVGKVADVMEGTISGNLFRTISNNIIKMGMSVSDAIFHPKYGALIYFPSNVIESSMKVLIESVKKGPKVAAQALMNVSRYIKEIHKVNERLKDLMADVISSMTSQIKFLTPVIAGIVIGITAMITNILGKLSQQLGGLNAGDTGGGVSNIAIFGNGIPTYYFQIIVGIYVVQIIYILSILVNGIENGSDKLNENYLIGVNVTKGTILYIIVAAIVMILFTMISGKILVNTIAS